MKRRLVRQALVSKIANLLVHLTLNYTWSHMYIVANLSAAKVAVSLVTKSTALPLARSKSYSLVVVRNHLLPTL
jgi:hypothetical protein